MAALSLRRIHRGQPALIALALSFCASRAYAHGVPARALAPLARAGEHVLYQLTRGLALHDATGDHYFCPSPWDGNEQAPVLAGTTAVRADAEELQTIDADGRVQAGEPWTNVIALAGGHALALEGERYVVRRLRDGVVLWSAAQAEGDWLSLGASESTLLLSGLEGAALVSQLWLSLDGSVRASARALAFPGVLAVQARPTDDAPYALLTSESGDRLELGVIERGAWTARARASANLAGPVVEGTRTWVAIDGVLRELAGEPRAPSPYITDLTRVDGVLYASVREGLRTLHEGELGALVFALSALSAPTTTNESCQLAWQHLQVDLYAAGLVPRDAGAADAGSIQDAAVEVPTAPTAPTAWLDAGASGREDAGCATTHPRSAAGWLALLWFTRRRRTNPAAASP